MEGRADLCFAQAGGQGAVEQKEFRVVFRPGEIPWSLLPEELQVLVVDVEIFVELGGVLHSQELILFPGGELFEGVCDDDVRLDSAAPAHGYPAPRVPWPVETPPRGKLQVEISELYGGLSPNQPVDARGNVEPLLGHSLSVGPGPYDGGSLEILEGAGHDLRGAGRPAVDQDHRRAGDEPAGGGIVFAAGPAAARHLRDDRDPGVIDQEVDDLHSLLEESAAVASQVQDETFQTSGSFAEIREDLSEALGGPGAEPGHANIGHGLREQLGKERRGFDGSMLDDDVEGVGLSPSVDLDMDRLPGLLVSQDRPDVLRPETDGRFSRQGHHPVTRVQRLARAGVVLVGEGPGDDEGRQPAELEELSSEAQLASGASSARPVEVGWREESGKVELVYKGPEGCGGQGLYVHLSRVDEFSTEHVDEFFQRVARPLPALDLEVLDTPCELSILSL